METRRNFSKKLNNINCRHSGMHACHSSSGIFRHPMSAFKHINNICPEM